MPAWGQQGELSCGGGARNTAPAVARLRRRAAAREQRHRVRFNTASALVNELVEARAANTLSRALGRWKRTELIGLAKLGAELSFQVVAGRAERAAVIVINRAC